MTSTARLLTAAIATLAMAPVAASAQTNAFGYTLASGGSLDYVAPPTGATLLGLSDDGSQTVTLPWSFEYYGVSYPDVTVYSNGGLGFVSGYLGTSSSCLPQLSTADILPYWDDLNPASAGGVYTWADTTGGNDRFIVSWEGVPVFGGSTTNAGTFQVHLHSSGAIEFHYLDTDFDDPLANHGADAVIGIQDDNGTVSDELEFSCDTVQTLESTSVSFTTCVDVDGDGYDDVACGGDDCDDSDSAINPGALEVCDDTVDDDCDGSDLTADADADGYDSEGCVGGDDCDDTNAAINPGVDADGDGSNACDDCNDSPGIGQFIFPGNTEICGNSIDDDCNGIDDLPDVDGDGYTNVNCGGDDCDDSDAAINVGVDVDGDGSNACDDCDDNEAAAFPGGTEICDSGIDNDCDGNVDDIDADNDGDLAIACGGTDCDDNDPTVGATTDADADGSNACDDCDDSDATIYPGAPEVCDTIDQDCDGLDDVFDLDVNSGGTTTTTEGPGPLTTITSFFPLPSDISVAGSAIIVDLDVELNATYPAMDEVTITLTSPLGTTVTLWDGVGVSGADLTNTVLDDEASGALSSGTAPWTGSFLPVDALSAFDGEDAMGTWSLSATTTNFLGVGTVDAWNLLVTTGAVDDSDGDGAVDSCGDCDDTDASIYPGAPETCGDLIDQDCDGIDQDGDIDGDTYIDANCGGDDCDDNDAALNPGVDVDADGSNACDDCDDNDATNFPGNLEICADGIDQDCDGSDDSGDADGDTYISDNCIGGDDCDDTNASVFPGAFDQDGDGFDVCADCYDISGDTEPLINPDEPEVCDGLDNDCDGTFDNVDDDGDGFLSDACGGDDCDDTDAAINPQTDADGDGFHACLDCDDTSVDVFPGNTEICDDGIDQSCTGADLVGDVDGDTYLSAACGGDDCDDEAADVNPGATDICDGVDLNCDGNTTTTDEDGDGFYDADCGGQDCDDSMQGIHPDAVEVCDGVDNNCDGALLDGGEDDADGDGVPACSDDCDDNDETIYPGAQELCDGIDNDCDGAADNGVIRDGDQDGHEREGCGGDDCDDGQAQAFPGNQEDCTDAIDNDCDGAVDSNDDDCDFGSGGCGNCDAGGSEPTPVGVLALLLVALGLRARRRPWSAS